VAIGRHRAATTVAAVLAVLAAAGAVLVVWSQERRADPAPSAASNPAGTPAAQAGPAGSWVAVENRRPGTAGWRITRLGAPEAIQGWADQASAATGERVRLYVSTTAPRFQVEAYRMGWYGGRGARLVWRSQSLVGRRQPAPTLTPETNMVATRWRPSLTVRIGPDWPPGVYLLKLVAASGQRYVPLTVRDDASRAALAVMSAVTTWQAYNLWGGRNQYVGPDGRLETRSAGPRRPALAGSTWPFWAPTPSTATSAWSRLRPGRTASRSTTSPGRSGMTRPGRPTPPRSPPTGAARP
jgi:hypothetical protein